MTDRPGTDRFDLIGQPLRPGRGSVPGVVIVKPETSTMTRAERDGVYTLNGIRYRTRKGANLPDGAVMDADPAEERAQPKAPENKAKAAAPETKAKGK